VLSVGGVACEGPNPTLSATAESVEIGTGEEAFARVPEGTVLSTVFGGQGGRHVWGSMRLGGLAISGGPPVGGVGMQVTFGIDHAQGPIASVGPVTANVNAATGEFFGATIIVQADPSTSPFLYPPDFSLEPEWPSPEEWEEAQDYLDAQVAEDLRMWVSVEDAAGAVHEDEVIIGLQGVYAESFSY